jgi:very-short-patch-repair endonuclease
MPDKRLIQFARQLRKDSTDAERRIWSYLRGERLGGHVFRRQHPIVGYIADFYCHAAKLVVELDGGQHTDPDAVAYDARRSAAMAAQGVHVIRFSDIDALKNSDQVAEAILTEVDKRMGKEPQS